MVLTVGLTCFRLVDGWVRQRFGGLGLLGGEAQRKEAHPTGAI
jgi:hypothetical protein